MILTPLEKIELPPGVREARTDLVHLFPSVGLPEVLLDVEHWAHYTKELTHLTGRRASSAEREAATRPAVFAVLVAEATNIGLAAMANSSGIALHELEAVYDWYFREETLRASIQHLISYRRTLPLTSSFGDGTTSSSDGIRFGMAASDLQARHHPRYFGMRRGVTLYNHVNNRGDQYWIDVVNCLLREATYVLDGLLYQDAPDIKEHYTDTGGYTDQVFALTALLGFRFAPRLRDALSHRLYLLNEVGEYGSLGTLLFGQINSKLITEQWDEMRRVASSIRHGTVSASLLMRKLAAYPRQNRVARALTEMGKLERTAFLLEYFRDESLRRRILIGLNKGEALHALARQLFFGRLGELRDRAFEDQMHRASCLHLIMAAIAAWNTVYLTEAIATLRKQGEDIPEATVAHIAPLGWEHIRLIGDYHFVQQSGRSLENLRPLRLQGEEESA